MSIAVGQCADYWGYGLAGWPVFVLADDFGSLPRKHSHVGGCRNCQWDERKPDSWNHLKRKSEQIDGEGRLYLAPLIVSFGSEMRPVFIALFAVLLMNGCRNVLDHETGVLDCLLGYPLKCARLDPLTSWPAETLGVKLEALQAEVKKQTGRKLEILVEPAVANAQIPARQVSPGTFGTPITEAPVKDVLTFISDSLGLDCVFPSGSSCTIRAKPEPEHLPNQDSAAAPSW